MTTPNLAKIERVDLREAWPNEARDFTPWLAKNIVELGEALGMDLELQDTEAAVGGYSLDVLATDLNQNRPVIIENQLETTNHDHLGKLLTYAAGYEANVIVWLTKEFRDEHRQALDWLNRRTDKDTEFFGVVVELLKIDGSRPAPQFRTVATPNDWRKEAAAKVRGDAPVASVRGERYREFFQPLIDTLREKHKFTNVRKAQPQNWYSFSAGYGQRITYGANFTGQKQARIEVYIDDGDNERNIQLLERLEEHREQVESALGETLDWQRLENRRACRIALDRPGSIEDDADTLAEVQDWMVDRLLKFKQVFEPRLSELLG
jgi:hypothetical protein